MERTSHYFLIACLLAGGLADLASLAQAGAAEASGLQAAPGAALTGGSSGIYVTTVPQLMAANKTSHEEESDYQFDSAQAHPVTFQGTAITTSAAGITISGTTATITAAGIYRLSGTLDNGQLVVNAAKSAVVRLVLDGLQMTCTTSAPINIQSAKKVIVVLAENSRNTLTDGANYVFPDAGTDEPNATLYSKCDMTIYGQGVLTVNAKYNDAIASKDGLIIAGGTINVKSVDDGIRGKDYLIIKKGEISVEVSGDGLKADNEDEANCGYIWIQNGRIAVTAGDDGLTAESDALVSGGTLSLVTGGGSNYTASDEVSAKGIKGSINTVVDDGILTVNSADDAVHSNRHLVINGGILTLSSSDDGIHADSTLGINGGEITISKCYEGIESKMLAFNNGRIHLTASDDGINAAGGADGSGTGGWGQPPMARGNYFLYLNGGYIAVNAAGDGIDVNGTIEMTGGTVLVHGPTSDGNAALDYDRGFTISGGFLLAAGSAGMAQAPGNNSSQNSIMVNFPSRQTAGTLFSVTNSSGDNLVTFAPARIYQSVVFSSPQLQRGSIYTVYTKGSSTGTVSDGLYSGGVYSLGSKYARFTLNSVTTKLSTSTDIDSGEAALLRFALLQNYPNPFNLQTTIPFELTDGSLVRLSLFNLLGQEVARLVDGPMAAGAHAVVWNGAGVPGGAYLVRLTAGAKSAMRRIVLVK